MQARNKACKNAEGYTNDNRYKYLPKHPSFRKSVINMLIVGKSSDIPAILKSFRFSAAKILMPSDAQMLANHQQPNANLAASRNHTYRLLKA
jgi:hypothetical protein